MFADVCVVVIAADAMSVTVVAARAAEVTELTVLQVVTVETVVTVPDEIATVPPTVAFRFAPVAFTTFGTIGAQDSCESLVNA